MSRIIGQQRFDVLREKQVYSQIIKADAKKNLHYYAIYNEKYIVEREYLITIKLIKVDSILEIRID